MNFSPFKKKVLVNFKNRFRQYKKNLEGMNKKDCRV